MNTCEKHSLTGLAYMAQWAKALGAVSLAVWLVRQGVGSSPTPAGMSSQVSACYEIKFSGRYRGFACVLFKLSQAITPGLGASGCGESRRCGQQLARTSGLI